MLLWNFTFPSTFIIIPVFITVLYFLPSTLHLHLHYIWFVNISDSFIPVIILKTLKCKSSVLFRTNTLLDRSLRVL